MYNQHERRRGRAIYVHSNKAVPAVVYPYLLIYIGNTWYISSGGTTFLFLLCLQFWFCLLLLHLPWYLFSLRFGFLHFPSALVLISSAFLSVNVSFCRFSLGPSFSDPSLNTRCGGIYSLISLFRIAASSTPFYGLLG